MCLGLTARDPGFSSSPSADSVDMAHLDSQTLDGPNVQDILGDLGMLLANKVFTKEGSDLERYVANDLESKIIPLLRVLNFVNV